MYSTRDCRVECFSRTAILFQRKFSCAYCYECVLCRTNLSGGVHSRWHRAVVRLMFCVVVALFSAAACAVVQQMFCVGTQNIAFCIGTRPTFLCPFPDLLCPGSRHSPCYTETKIYITNRVTLETSSRLTTKRSCCHARFACRFITVSRHTRLLNRANVYLTVVFKSSLFLYEVLIWMFSCCVKIFEDRC